MAEKRTAPILTRLSEEERNELNRAASMEDLNAAQLVRRAIRNELDRLRRERSERSEG